MDFGRTSKQITYFFEEARTQNIQPPKKLGKFVQTIFFILEPIVKKMKKND